MLPDLRIAYDTHGTLSPARDNAILLMPGATGDRHAFDPLIGPGKMFDTDRYFVIAVDPVAFCRLIAYLARHRPQILHTHLVHADAYGQMAGVLARADWNFEDAKSFHLAHLPVSLAS